MLLPLALKSLTFSLLLFLASNHWFMVIILVLVAFYFYFRPSLNGGKFILSFLVLLAVSFLAVRYLDNISMVASLFFGSIFFLLLGVKNLIFVHRQHIYYFFNGFLFLAIFVLFFLSGNSGMFFIKYFLVFLAVAFLSKEFLYFSFPDSLSSSKKNLVAYGAAFLIIQFLWGISLLPLSFLNAASLALLVALILQDFFVHHFSGTMNRQIILRNITLFLILGLVVLGASKWAL